MAVLSVGVLAKSGKVLLARQYVDMSRIRIEGILAAFPKLIDSSDGASRQHTYVETGSIRYVYQPMDGLYLLLVTTRGSNIVQDLDTLRLLAKVVPEYAQLTEEDVSRNVFDLIFAFDEVITLGYKENITLEGIRTNLEMDSHNEKLFMMVHQSKVKDAMEEAKRREQAIRASRAANPMPGIGSSSMQGIGNTPGFGSSETGFGNTAISSSDSTMDTVSSSPSRSGSRYGSSAEALPTTTSANTGPVKTLSLGKKEPKGLSTLAQMAKEEGIDAKALLQQKSTKVASAVPGAVIRNDPIEVRIAELVTVLYDRDGALLKIEIKGSITLLCSVDDSRIRLQLENQDTASQFQFTPHPNLSKQDFLSANVLQLKDVSKPFPKDKSLNILKWRYAAKDDSDQIPLKVTCWPEDNDDGTMTVTMEVELLVTHIMLRDVLLAIPLNTTEEPEITSIDAGSNRHNAKKHLLEWEIPVIEANSPTATMEFIVRSSSEDDFFPVSVTFSSQDIICPINLVAVQNVDTQEPQKFGLYRELKTSRYEIVAQAE